MFVYVIFMLALIYGTDGSQNDTFSVFDKLKSGLKLAGQFLISDQASGVATLVSKAFEKPHTMRNGTESNNNIFSGFLRILGFDSKRIGAITVNAIIFIAQLISSSISLKPPSQITAAKKSEKNENLFDWVTRNEGIVGVMSSAKDDNLSNMVIEYVKERSLDEETGCVQLLLCKSSPFIRHMQKSISEKGNASTRGYNALFAYLPDVDEFSENGDRCEKKHPYCSIPL